jgi:uncharacterized protein
MLLRRSTRLALLFLIAGLPASLVAQQRAPKSAAIKPAAAKPAAAPMPATTTADTGRAAAPAQRKTVERFLAITNMEQLYAQSLEASIAGQLQANPPLKDYEDILRSFMDKYGSYRALKPDLVRLYAETFSEADMQEAIRFYQTDFGKRFLGKMPELMARGNQIGAQRVQEHLPELVEKVQKRMQQKGGGR